MAKTLYPLGAQKILSGAINFTSDTIKVVFLTSGYTYSAAHEFLAAVGANTVGTAQTLGTKSVAGGVFDAADVDFGAVAAGSTIKAVLMYKDTGSSATSPLIMYHEDFTGFPFATNGAELDIPWNNGAGKIFTLVP